MNVQANIAVNLQVFVCSLCGEDHKTENCPAVHNFKVVHDSQLLSRARQTLPKDLKVVSLSDGSTTVITDGKIEEGTCFGPLEAPLSVDLPPSVSFPLKVFGKNLDEGYYMDTTDEASCNWMCLVATATSAREQNLICYDVRESIYFATTRDIQPGEQLRVWYALYYGLKLQALPLVDDPYVEESFNHSAENAAEENFKSKREICVKLDGDLLHTLAQQLPAHALGASGERDTWICKLCGLQESNVSSYARHLMTHYSKSFNNSSELSCEICSKCFFSKQMLMRHLMRIHKFKVNQQPTVSKAAKAEPQETKKSSVKGESIESEGTFPGEHINDERDGSSMGDVSRGIVKVCDIRTSSTRCKDWLLGNLQLEDPDLIHSDSLEGCILNRAEDECEDKAFTVLYKEAQSGEADSSSSICPEDAIHSSCDHQGAENSSFQMSELLETHSLGSQFSIGNKDDREGDQIVIHSSNGETFSTSFEFGETHTMDIAAKNGQPVTLIMVESSMDSNIPPPNLTERLISSSDSSLPSKMEDSIAIHSQPSTLSKSGKESVSFSCDICQKSFGKCSYLYRHLRKHTGEFTCVTCLAVFARKENLKTHSCSQPKQWFPCKTCGKKFSVKKYLQRHSPMHTGEFACSDCNRNFVSRLSLKFHRCISHIKVPTKTAVNCFLCERVFDAESKLRAHLKVHSDVALKPSMTSSNVQNTSPFCKENSENSCDYRGNERVFVCEICGAVFKSSSSMKTHIFRHGERRFECDVCKKRFHRKDVLQDHLTVHKEANFPCQLCGRKYKTKKSLHVHSLIHMGSKRFSCGTCGKQFFQKGNLMKHLQTHDTVRVYNCGYCEKTFSSKEYFHIHELTHTQGKIYQCEDCQKGFVKKHMLDSHRQVYHSNRGFLCKFCNTVIRHRHSARRHMEKNHNEHRKEWSLPGFIDHLRAELPINFLLHSSEIKLNPKEQQQRQRLLQSIRNKHFKINSFPKVDNQPRNAIMNISVSSSDILSSQLLEGDPLLMHSLSQQYTLSEDESDFRDVSNSMVPISNQGSVDLDGDVVLTLVDQDSLGIFSGNNVPSVVTSTGLENETVDVDAETRFMMADGNGGDSVLLYVVETSNDDDLVWGNGAVHLVERC